MLRSPTDAQLLAGKTDTIDNGLTLATTGFFTTVCSGVKFHFDVEAIHIGIGFDNLKCFPHGDIAASGRNPGRGHYDKDRPAIIAWVSRQGDVVIHATRDFTAKTVQKAADIAVQAGSRPYTDSAGSYRALTGYVYDFVNQTKKEYTRGDVHENRAECLFSLLKPYLYVFRGIRKTYLPGYLGFFRFLRTFVS